MDRQSFGLNDIFPTTLKSARRDKFIRLDDFTFLLFFCLSMSVTPSVFLYLCFCFSVSIFLCMLVSLHVFCLCFILFICFFLTPISLFLFFSSLFFCSFSLSLLSLTISQHSHNLSLLLSHCPAISGLWCLNKSLPASARLGWRTTVGTSTSSNAVNPYWIGRLCTVDLLALTSLG